jgi:dihydrofolate synthase/folylpolyglutamate synthase
MKFTNYNQAINYLNSQLPKTPKTIFKGEEGFKNAVDFMNALGKPQDQFRSIHIAATSGKGTVAMMVSAILKEHSFRVGLTVSPYVYDVRERVQINNQLIKKATFMNCLNHIMPIIEQFTRLGRRPTYFKVLLAMAFKIFAMQKVDYAVVETGLGGLLDATNTIKRADKLAVIGKIGKDHTEILGKTYAEIAAHKAGIINDKNQVIALTQKKNVNNEILKQTQIKQAKIMWVKPSDSAKFLEPSILTDLNDQLWGDFEYENLALALASTQHLAMRDGWEFDKTKVKKALKNLKLPGRFERIESKNKTFIFDGAHNQQKLDALFEATKAKYKNHPYGVILAMRETKSVPALQGASQIITTSFSTDLQDMEIRPKDPNALAIELKTNHVTATSNIKEAINKAINSDIDLWLITGSFFVLAEAKDILKKVFNK